MWDTYWKKCIRILMVVSLVGLQGIIFSSLYLYKLKMLYNDL